MYYEYNIANKNKPAITVPPTRSSLFVVMDETQKHLQRLTAPLHKIRLADSHRHRCNDPTGDTPTLYGAMYSLNTQVDKHLTIGAMSALEIHGYSHYLPMGRPTVSLSAPQKEYLPLWFRKYDWGVTLRLFTTEIFNSDTGSPPPDKGFSSCRSLPRNGRSWSVYISLRNITTLPTSIM